MTDPSDECGPPRFEKVQTQFYRERNESKPAESDSRCPGGLLYAFFEWTSVLWSPRFFLSILVQPRQNLSTEAAKLYEELPRKTQ